MSQRKFFISYRRDDAPTAAHVICDRLQQRFGEEQVFFDFDSIPLGCDFHQFLTEQVQSCQILVVVIGRRWLDMVDDKGRRRLDLEDDFVRIEIQSALERQIPVVPVLVEGAAMPQASQLPESLYRLARHNGANIRSGAMFHQELEMLVQKLELSLQSFSKPPSPDQIPTNAPAPVQICREILTTSVGLKLAGIPAGRFLRGSPDDEVGRYPNEGPQHEVELTRGFYLGVTPVTQDEYQQVVGSNPSHFTVDGRRPVERVTWWDAVTFCNRLSELEQLTPFYSINDQQARIVGGDGYRLPTEAEWEYACRAGTTSRWWFGDDESRLTEFAWFDQNSGGETHRVGEQPANAWGLHDLHGNVWEWCQDWFGKYASGHLSDPTGPESGAGRVVRGGSWGNVACYCRAAIRGGVHPAHHVHAYGFRVARSEEWPGTEI